MANGEGSSSARGTDEGLSHHQAPVTWAQRDNFIYVNVCVEDLKEVELSLEEGALYFKVSLSQSTSCIVTFIT